MTPGLRLTALVVGLSLVAAACGDDAEDPEPQATTTTTEAQDEGVEEGGDHGNVDGRFKAATVLPLTGDLRAYGAGMQAAVELAVDQINAAGGVLSPMELETFDGATDAATAQTAAAEAVDAGADFVIGEAGAEPTLDGVIPALGRDTSVAGCSGSASTAALSDPQYDDWMRTVPSEIGQAPLLAAEITDAGHHRLAIAYRADDHGEALAEALAGEAEAARLEVVADVAVEPEAEKVGAEVKEIVAARPDAVAIVTYPVEGAAVIAGLFRRGVTPAQLYGGRGVAEETLAAAVDPTNRNVLDGMSGTRPGGEATGDSPFEAELKAKKRVEEVTFAESTANCLFIYALAAHEAKSDDARKVRPLLPGVTSGGTACATYADCLQLIDAGTDYRFTAPGIVLNEALEPDEGLFDVWVFGGGGAIQVRESVTVPIEPLGR